MAKLLCALAGLGIGLTLGPLACAYLFCALWGTRSLEDGCGIAGLFCGAWPGGLAGVSGGWWLGTRWQGPKR